MELLKCFCGALAKEDNWESAHGEVFMVFCPECDIAFRSVEGPQAARDGWLKAMEKAASKGKSGWRPIETAPRDESWLIGHWQDSQETATVRFRAWRWENTDGEIVFKPTAWMPLPEVQK